MNARDPHFTLRLEDALRLLARRSLPLPYITRRFQIGDGDLQAWLNEFNHGLRSLPETRIDEVKRELGSISTGAESAATTASAAPRPVAATTDAAKPEAKRLEPVKLAPALATAATKNWNDSSKLMPSAFERWRPVLAAYIAESGRKSLSQIARAEDLNTGGAVLYSKQWFGVTTPPVALVQDFLAWADARCGAQKKPQPAKPTAPAAPSPAVAVAPASTRANGKEAVKPDERHRWRADAIAALVTMGTKTRQAEAQVDAAITRLAGADCDTGALVKLALREVPAAPPAATRKEVKPPTDAPVMASATIPIGGTLLKLELTLRLVQIGGAS